MISCPLIPYPTHTAAFHIHIHIHTYSLTLRNNPTVLGKTAAFALPILQLCAEAKKRSNDGKPKDRGGGGTSQHLPRLAMSLQDRDPSIAIDPESNNLRIQSRDASKWACRASMRVSLSKPGKYSFACGVLDEGLVLVGWSTSDASLQLGTDHEGYGYGGTGVKVHRGNFDQYPSDRECLEFGKGDVIGCHVEIIEPQTDAGKKVHSKLIAVRISFSKNEEFLGHAFEISRKDVKAGDALFPTVCHKNAECSLHFGGSDDDKAGPSRTFALPQDFKPLDSLLSNGTGGGGQFNPRDASFSRSSSGKGPLAIVIEPTRELAEQTYRGLVDLAVLMSDPSVEIALLVGGMSPKATLQQLEKNNVDVLVGTPPIVATYMKKGTIQSNRCRFFVLDEADELIGSDSIKNIRSIYGRLLAANAKQSVFERLQVCFFSATLHSKEVRELSETICFRPLWIDLRGHDESIQAVRLESRAIPGRNLATTRQGAPANSAVVLGRDCGLCNGQ